MASAVAHVNADMHRPTSFLGKSFRMVPRVTQSLMRLDVRKAQELRGRANALPRRQLPQGG
jgi:hypothetical protein